MKALKLTHLLLFIILCHSQVSCVDWIISEDLTLAVEPYDGTELRMNGYYYYMQNNRIMDTYIFYKNGILIHGNYSENNDGNSICYMDSLFLSPRFLEGMNKYNYGAFHITKDSIVIEKWMVLSGPHYVLLVSGNILNDTTFVINRNENSYTGNVFQMEKLFHFHAFSPKPDSTNVFIP